MKMTRSVVGVASMFWIATAMWSTTASASGQVAAQAKREIEQALRGMETLQERGADGKELSKALYAEEIVIVGEGDSKAQRGLAAATAETQGWLDSLGPNGVKTCKFTLVDPVVASRETFSSFVLLHCKANPPVMREDQDLRMMYIWKKYPQGWRVVLEMFAPGKF